MKPVEFPEVNKRWGEGQPEYQVLPAYSDSRVTIACWQMTWRERLKVLFTGRIWCRLMNFGGPLTPSLLEVDSPFIDPLDAVNTARARAPSRPSVGGRDA